MKNKIKIGMKIYYRGDMANIEDFGEITEIIINKWGKFFSTKLEDGREQKKVPFIMMDFVDNGNGRTRFCTLEAYEARRKAQFEKYKIRAVAIK
jgi:hypothetical protein